MPYYTVFAATDFLNKESGGVNSVLKLIGLIILCILIIVASYYTTKFVGKKQLGRSPKSNFRSIDVFRLSTNKYLQIVEVGERYFCIAVAKDTITVVGELSKENQEWLDRLIKASKGKAGGKFFAGGDIVNGGPTIVEAVAEGKEAAEAMIAYLEKKGVK